jgi:hypothetical protein
MPFANVSLHTGFGMLDHDVNIDLHRATLTGAARQFANRQLRHESLSPEL